jgi:DamX protein
MALRLKTLNFIRRMEYLTELVDSHFNSIVQVTMDSQLPDYLARYGFKADPFATKDDDASFFETPSIAQRLDLIQHLIEYSGQLLLVTGEQGSGKTTLLKQLLRKASNLWRVCLIDGGPSVDARALVKRIGHAFGLQPQQLGGNEPNPYFELLQARIDAYERSNLVPVLLVDDAHNLPPESLRLLFSLILADDQHAKLHVVLFAEPRIKDALEAFHPKDQQQDIMHVIDIPNLNEEQAWAYLQRRFSNAGFTGKMPLSETVLRNIYREADGLPGRLNALALQALRGGDNAVTSKASEDEDIPAASSTGGKWQLATLAAVLAMATVVVAMISFIGPPETQENVADVPLQLPAVAEQEPEQALPPLPVPPPPPPPPGEPNQAGTPETPVAAAEPEAGQPPASGTEAIAPATPAPVAQAPAQPTGEVAAPAANPVPPPAPTEQPVAPQPPQKPVPPAPAVAAVKPVTPPSPPAPVEPARTPAAKPVAAPPPPASPATTAQASGSGWLAGKNGYLLQLMGSHDKRGVLEFMAQPNLPANVTWLVTNRRGRDWYVVVSGPFPTRERAAAAISSLPPAVKINKPWPRPVGELRQSVRP